MPKKLDFYYAEQSINNVVQLKTFIDGIAPIWQALSGATSEELVKIRSVCCSFPSSHISATSVYSLIDPALRSRTIREHQNTDWRMSE